MATVPRVAASAAMCQRADAQVTGPALSAESTTSHLGTSASSAKLLALCPVTATALLAEGTVPARATGGAVTAK